MKKSILIIIATLFFSCSKNEPLSMSWDLTGCLNPWDSYVSLDTFSIEGYNAGIFDYLSKEGINVNYITSEFDSSKVELCYACHCKTGVVITVNIPIKHKRKLKNLVPNNQFNLSFY